MIHRTALFAATLAATVALVFGLALAGFNPGVSQPTADPVVASVDPAPQPTVQVDTVYLTPPVAPQDITVTRTQAAGGGENEHEGRDD
jgi:hypothetical protein